MSKYIFDIYIAGQTTRAKRAIKNLHDICEAVIPGDYNLTIIDVLEQPGKAEEDKILATPTLVKRQPGPQRKIIGDLADMEKVVRALEIE